MIQMSYQENSLNNTSGVVTEFRVTPQVTNRKTGCMLILKVNRTRTEIANPVVRCRMALAQTGAGAGI